MLLTMFRNAENVSNKITHGTSIKDDSIEFSQGSPQHFEVDTPNNWDSDISQQLHPINIDTFNLWDSVESHPTISQTCARNDSIELSLSLSYGSPQPIDIETPNKWVFDNSPPLKYQFG